MSLSFLSPARTVLLVSDEFLSVFSVSGAGVKLMDSVPWNAENFESNVASIVAKDCGKKPVLILNDMVEQHYRKERVVKVGGVGVMDKSSMVARKLNVAFPNYPIKAAYPLKEKIPKTDSAPAADIYIFAAVAGSDQVTQTIAASKKSLASIAGFCLLPIEASDMVKTLSVKLGGKKGRKKNKWSIFIGQHRSGSLRQVLTKNGELALTRMSPIVDNDSDPEVWARELYQEFKSTMSYLSRFGYDPDDGLDVFVAANETPGEALKSIFEEECDLHVMHVNEIAKFLGISIGKQPDSRCADVLHIAWTGRKSRFILPMKATQVDEVSRPRQVAMVAGLALFAGVSFLGYQALSQLGLLTETYSEIETSSRQKSQLDAQYQREVRRLEEVGFDAKLVQSSLAVYEDFQNERIQALRLFKGVGQALGKDLRIDDIVVAKPPPPVISNPWEQPSQNKGPLFEATLKMTYPSTADVDKGNKEVADLRNRIESLLQGHTVKVTKFLKDYEYTEGLVVEAGDLQTENVQQDFVAEIMIEGPEQGANEQ